eukprot:5618182-Prymnesium_polylepis.1
MVRHRSAVDAATRDVLHDVGRLAAGHRLLQRRSLCSHWSSSSDNRRLDTCNGMEVGHLHA